METERLSLVVEVGTGEMLTGLAQGERRRGQWLTRLVRAMADNQQVGSGADVAMLRMTVQGLVAEVAILRAEVMRLAVLQ